MEEIASKVIELAEKYLPDFRIRNGQVISKTCPFCHGGDHSDSQTFAIGLYNGAWQCLRGSCGAKGSFRELCENFGERVDFSYRAPTARAKKTYDKPDPRKLQPVTEDIITYFATRRISEETIRAFGISADENGNIIFPFYRDGDLVFVKYRQPKKFNKESGMPKEWQDANTESILFGMDKVVFNRPLYITEGEIDAMSLYEAGIYNVVSVPSGSNNTDWISNCWDWLEKFQQIVIFGDTDEPGIQMVNNVMKRLGEDRCLIAPDYPDLVVEGRSAGRMCKDANEILYAYGPSVLKDVADRCEPAPIEGILNVSDIQFVDPTSVPRIYTKIDALDNALAGLSEGSVTVISGKRGEGKSTIGGQFLLNAIEQGVNVAAYSGELTASKFLEWLVLQATESKYIGIKRDERTGKPFAVTSFEIQKRIRNWLNMKAFLFDNTYVTESSQEEAILKSFTMCARRYGCKLFLVDNMMTVVNSAEEENKAQAKFASALKKFACKYSCAVILVAHPRKSKPGEAFTNDTVSGSSVITNIADNVLSIEKPNIRITKNRDFGTTAYIQCSFNPANRRIFQTSTGDRTVYSWDHTGISIPEEQACEHQAFAIQNGSPENEERMF